MQVKLLRFLQERVIERIGGRKAIPINARIVTATHQDLTTLMQDGRFREDLYYRLAEMVIRIPSLAERPGDAVLLAKHFQRKFRAAKQGQAKGFAPAALTALGNWPWTGNVRELENRVKRAMIMADGPLITPADLDLDEPADGEMKDLKTAREVADRAALATALANNDGNMSAAARELNISRPMLYHLLSSYGMSKK
jgi:two-component system NtrC family response regulator